MLFENERNYFSLVESNVLYSKKEALQSGFIVWQLEVKGV